MKEYRTRVFSAQKRYTNRSAATPGEVSRSCMVWVFIPLSLSSINRAYADKRVLCLVKLLKPGALLVKAGVFTFTVVTPSTLHLLSKWKYYDK